MAATPRYSVPAVLAGAGGAGGTPGGVAGGAGNPGTNGLFGTGGSPSAAAVSFSAASSDSIFGPYEDLFHNTVTNLQSVSDTWLTDPAPLLTQFLTNQFGYGSLTFKALTDATRDFTIGLANIPADLRAGDVAGALVGLFVSGIDAGDLGNIKLLGTVGSLFPPLTIPGNVAQNFTNVLRTVLDTNIAFTLDTATLSGAATVGLPLAMTLNAVGSPITTALAFAQSTTAFTSALQTGNLQAAATALVGAPANIANGFLNGEATLPLTLPLSATAGIPVTLNIPVGGILSPLRPIVANAVAPVIGPISITLGGTPAGGLIPALLNYAPAQLANAIA